MTDAPDTSSENIDRIALSVDHYSGENPRRRASDMLRALAEELDVLHNAGIAEIAARNPSVMEYMKHWEGRAETAEAERDDAVVDVRVKPLEWEDFPKDDGPVLSKAVTLLGTYFICDDTDDFSGLYLNLIGHDDARWWQHVRSTCVPILDRVHDDDLTPIKAAAQAHYEARILAMIEQPQTKNPGQMNDRG